MRKAKELLDAVTKKYPHPFGAKHALLVDQGQLHLVLALEKRRPGASEGTSPVDFQHIVFRDEEDLDAPVDAILLEVEELLRDMAETN